jgi:hypothetical protein
VVAENRVEAGHCIKATTVLAKIAGNTAHFAKETIKSQLHLDNFKEDTALPLS